MKRTSLGHASVGDIGGRYYQACAVRGICKTGAKPKALCLHVHLDCLPWRIAMKGNAGITGPARGLVQPGR